MKGKILIVDDQFGIRILLNEVLQTCVLPFVELHSNTNTKLIMTD